MQNSPLCAAVLHHHQQVFRKSLSAGSRERPHVLEWRVGPPAASRHHRLFGPSSFGVWLRCVPVIAGRPSLHHVVQGLKRYSPIGRFSQFVKGAAPADSVPRADVLDFGHDLQYLLDEHLCHALHRR